MARPKIRAYNDPEFMSSPDARPLRILAEYLAPAARFKAARIKDTIVFFGSARSRPVPEAEAALAALEAGGAEPATLSRARRSLELARFGEAARELAHRLTLWSKSLAGSHRRFVVCSGGGPGIMEAANRGASEARGETIGLNITLPMEQFANPFTTRRLSFEFHYFFMRKYWFLYLAKALAIFPGGFGTLDELMEVLTLVQTRKVTKPIPIVIMGREYWSTVLNLQAMVDWGTIDAADLALFRMVDTADEAYEYLTTELTRHYLAGDGPQVDPPQPPAALP